MFRELQGFSFDEVDECQDQQPEIAEIPQRDIALIGMAVRLPLADHLEAFWGNLLQGIDAIRECPETRRRDLDNYLIRFKKMAPAMVDYFQLAYLNRVDQFDYAYFGLSPREASLMDPHQRLFLETAWTAMEDAGYGGERLRGSRTGVYVGLGGDGQYKRFISEVEPESLGAAIPGNIPSVTAGRIAYLMDFRGPSLLVDTACSSSLVAVHHACQALRNGDCHLAIAGSVKIHLLPLEFAGSDVGIRSSDGKTRTFDDRSDGTGYGEGAVAVLLKPLHRALEDGDHIYAVIKGTAVNQDGSSVGITAPNPAAQEDVLIRAWKDAGIEPETIRYIEAHGTGTKLGDPIEINGIQSAFAAYTDWKQFCAIGSVKTNIGHLDYAAGVAGLVKAALCLKRKMIPPTINFKRPNQKIRFEDSPVFVNDLPRDWEDEGIPRRCGVSAFGISGTNCHLVLEEAPQREGSSPDGAGAGELFTLSAKSQVSLRQLIADYVCFLHRAGDLSLRDLCYTANTGRGHYRYRIALVVENLDDLRGKLERLNAVDSGEELTAGRERPWVDVEGLTFNEAGLADPVVKIRTCREKGIFYGEHVVIGGAQCGKQAEWELTEKEKRERTEAARYLLTATEEGKDAVIFSSLAELYVTGAEIDWFELYRGEARCKVSLPTYSFERNRCWLEIPGDDTAVSGIQAVQLSGRESGEYTLFEREAAAIWGHVLGYREMKISDDFYALGGDSVSGLLVIKQVTQRLQLHVEIFELLRSASLEEFAALLEERNAIRPESEQAGISAQEIGRMKDEVMLLLNGDHRRKLFCFPPRMGQGLVYKQLAARVTDWAVYAFHFIEEEDRIERYVDWICRTQPEGPYILVGYSAGGSLVFDVASALLRQGRRVDDAILFDSANLERSIEPTPELLARIRYQFRAELEKEFSGISEELLDSMLRKQENYYTYLMRRGPLGQIDANIHLILAEHSRETKDRLRYVADLEAGNTTKDFLTYQGCGEHDYMLFRGAVEGNAEIFNRILTAIARKDAS